ncbi:type II toxin-antitoxin system RelE/ParE family toxin [Epilithonimonas xixisoli]|uniref:Plasmid stabilization system protein ParE n=1 Tax=Epilithonimonas xixisoli TaxID=1476462 RepID=A0A4R8IBP9_9FLAO|nr:type II toxin-antitoxin system RelE/ParE family toxin [Epilithonimonas xixisoli]TDX87134.1 plasmid stabilization system protein ParE [Epilithonimonas xixisoli]
MELKIFWSQLAEDQLMDIFQYYKLKAGVKIAKKIVNEIVDQTIDIDKNPKIGQTEELLKDRIQEFRYLVSSNYKIIYYINLETQRIVIANVFDTRQNPEKLSETK